MSLAISIMHLTKDFTEMLISSLRYPNDFLHSSGLNLYAYMFWYKRDYDNSRNISVGGDVIRIIILQALFLTPLR